MTDAHMVLGTIRPGAFLGGRDEARRRGGATRLRAAGGAPRHGRRRGRRRRDPQLADANIVRAIQLVSTERGRDPRDYALVPFGGAGPLLAAEIAEELGIATIVVPPNAGVVSAYGLLAADYSKFDAVTRKMPLDEAAPEGGRATFAEMRRALAAAQFADMDCGGDLDYTPTRRHALRRPGLRGRRRRSRRRARRLDRADLAERFADAHRRIYHARRRPAARVEIVVLRRGAAALGTLPAARESGGRRPPPRTAASSTRR